MLNNCQSGVNLAPASRCFASGTPLRSLNWDEVCWHDVLLVSPIPT